MNDKLLGESEPGTPVIFVGDGQRMVRGTLKQRKSCWCYIEVAPGAIEKVHARFVNRDWARAWDAKS